MHELEAAIRRVAVFLDDPKVVVHIEGRMKDGSTEKGVTVLSSKSVGHREYKSFEEGIPLDLVKEGCLLEALIPIDERWVRFEGEELRGSIRVVHGHTAQLLEEEKIKEFVCDHVNKAIMNMRIDDIFRNRKGEEQ